MVPEAEAEEHALGEDARQAVQVPQPPLNLCEQLQVGTGAAAREGLSSRKRRQAGKLGSNRFAMAHDLRSRVLRRRNDPRLHATLRFRPLRRGAAAKPSSI